MIDPENLTLANALSMSEASKLSDALSEALDAMAHFGSDSEPMQVVAMLLVVAKQEKASAFKTHEKLSAPRNAKSN